MKDPVEFLCGLFPNLDANTKTYRIETDCADDDYRSSNKLTIMARADVPHYCRILEASLIEFGIFEGRELSSSVNDSEIVLEILQVNSFESSIMLKGYLKGDHIDYEIAEGRGLAAKMYVKGIRKDSSLPLWLRCIVDAALYAKYNDERSAVLFIFISLESFVSYLHDDLIFRRVLDGDGVVRSC